MFRGSSQATTEELKTVRTKEIEGTQDRVQTTEALILSQKKRTLFDNVYWRYE